MDFNLDGLLSRFVLVLMLLEAQWRPVFPAPTQPNCDLNRTKDLTEILEHEANKLLHEYTDLHGAFDDTIPEEVPDPTVSGATISEKLQSIYVKNWLFQFHISKVNEYLVNLWGTSDSVAGHIKNRLPHHAFKIQTILTIIDPNTPLPATPAPLQLSHDHDYAKKVYGWSVIIRMKGWLKQVQQVLEEVQGCDN